MAKAGRDYLGSYRLIRMIRASKTCQVWEAIKDTDRTRVALKALHDSYIDDKSEIASLKHEYAVAHKFDHPNVIHVYEFNKFRGIPYLALEFCISRNMKMAIREEGTAVSYWAPKVVIAGAQALSYIHSQGWIHRDVKPDNFLLDYHGNIKLIDFSISEKKASSLAKLFGRGSKAMGTRSYMSPEQIRGKPLDDRADLYSYGCSLFEFIGGRLPYTANTPDELLDKHIRAPIPALQAANSNVTEEFSAIIAQTMAKDKTDRPKDMETLIELFKKVSIFKVPPKKPQSLLDLEKQEKEDANSD